MVYGLWFRVSFSSRVWAWGFGFCGDFLNFEISDLKPEEICSAQNVCNDSASWLPKIRLSASSEQESSRNCQKLSNQGEILDPSLMILDSLRNIRSREERPIYTILQIMVAWRSCCKTPSKVQYTYFCCSEFQFLHRHGQKDDETNSPGLHCKRGTQMLEILFCPFGMWLLLFN